MRRVYSTESADGGYHTYPTKSKETISKLVPMQTVKRLARYVKKYAKVGAYMEVEEIEADKFKVDIFAPKIHIDILGNMAMVKSPA
jgi:hypothetical protein